MQEKQSLNHWANSPSGEGRVPFSSLRPSLRPAVSAEYKGLGEATSEDNAKKFSKNELERFRAGLNLKDHDFQGTLTRRKLRNFRRR